MHCRRIGSQVGDGINPAREAVFTIWPKPCRAISRYAATAPSGSLSATTTIARLPASSSQTARPIPEAPPVTIATLSLNVSKFEVPYHGAGVTATVTCYHAIVTGLKNKAIWRGPIEL